MNKDEVLLFLQAIGLVPLVVYFYTFFRFHVLLLSYEAVRMYPPGSSYFLFEICVLFPLAFISLLITVYFLIRNLSTFYIHKEEENNG